MHSSLVIANKFLDLARKSGVQLTPMQLLKLVYMAHGWMLGLYERPLIEDTIEAWRYGPVIPPLYQAIRGYRDRPVQEINGVNDLVTSLDEYEEDILQQVFQKYGNRTGVQLSALTHQDGSPWKQVMDQCNHEECNPNITNDLISPYYRGLYEEQEANS